MWMMISLDLMLVGSQMKLLVINRPGFFFPIGALPLSYAMIHGFLGMEFIVLIAALFQNWRRTIIFIHFSRPSHGKYMQIRKG